MSNITSAHSCDACGAPASSQCPRCKDTFYCGRKCQKKAWPKHKNGCTPATPLAATRHCDPPPAAHHCDVCNGLATLRCTQCKSVWYCGRDCQRQAWPAHKHVCASPPGHVQLTRPLLAEAACFKCKKTTGELSDETDRICARIMFKSASAGALLTSLGHHTNAPACETCAHSGFVFFTDKNVINMLGNKVEMGLRVNGALPCVDQLCIFTQFGEETLYRKHFCAQLYRTLLTNPPDETVVVSHLSAVETHYGIDTMAVAPFHLCTQLPWSAFVREQMRVRKQVGPSAEAEYVIQDNGDALVFTVSVGTYAYSMRYYYIADSSNRMSNHRGNWLAHGLTATNIPWDTVTMYAILVPVGREPLRIPAPADFEGTDMLECPVCMEPTLHKMVQCGHPICADCSQGILARSTRSDPLDTDISCPLCRQQSVFTH